MREEHVNLSVAGMCALFFAGAFFGGMLCGHIDPPSIFMFIMLLVLLRADARESIREGEYKRGWFVWRRIGSVNLGESDG